MALIELIHDGFSGRESMISSLPLCMGFDSIGSRFTCQSQIIPVRVGGLWGKWRSEGEMPVSSGMVS